MVNLLYLTTIKQRWDQTISDVQLSFVLKKEKKIVDNHLDLEVLGFGYQF